MKHVVLNIFTITKLAKCQQFQLVTIIFELISLAATLGRTLIVFKTLNRCRSDGLELVPSWKLLPRPEEVFGGVPVLTGVLLIKRTIF